MKTNAFLLPLACVAICLAQAACALKSEAVNGAILTGENEQRWGNDEGATAPHGYRRMLAEADEDEYVAKPRGCESSATRLQCVNKEGCDFIVVHTEFFGVQSGCFACDQIGSKSYCEAARRCNWNSEEGTCHYQALQCKDHIRAPACQRAGCAWRWPEGKTAADIRWTRRRCVDRSELEEDEN